jgi:hypothetical protein
MFCSECGSKFHKSVEFCWNCGQAVFNINSVDLKSTESTESKNITHSPNVEGTDINENNSDISNEIQPSPKDVSEQLQYAEFWVRAIAFFLDVALFVVPLAIWTTIAKDENLSTGLSKTQGLLCLWLLFFLYDAISNY